MKEEEEHLIVYMNKLYIVLIMPDVFVKTDNQLKSNPLKESNRFPLIGSWLLQEYYEFFVNYHVVN